MISLYHQRVRYKLQWNVWYKNVTYIHPFQVEVWSEKPHSIILSSNRKWLLYYGKAFELEYWQPCITCKPSYPHISLGHNVTPTTEESVQITYQLQSKSACKKSSLYINEKRKLPVLKSKLLVLRSECVSNLLRAVMRWIIVGQTCLTEWPTPSIAPNLFPDRL